MKSTHFKVAGLAITMIVALSACGTSDGGNRDPGFTLTDKNFGGAVREARMRQTINLNTDSSDAQNVGTDAGSAVQAVKRYQDSKKNPKHEQ